MRRLAVVGLIAVTAVATVHLTRTPSWAGTKTCLTGTDASVANDLSEITAVRADVGAVCPCASFDGSKGKTHAEYVICASGVISTQVGAGNLRTQCKSTVKKYYSVSTCGVPASKGDAPCIQTRAAGKVRCTIKPTAKCKGNACPSFTTCIDAADTNGDGIIGKGDSGTCAAAAGPTNTPTQLPQGGTPTPTSPVGPPPPTNTHTLPPGAPTNTPTTKPTITPLPTNTPLPTPTATFTLTPCTNGFVDNGDGTVTDHCTGLMWEKKDQAGGIHDEGNSYTWSSTGTAADGTAFTVFLATLNTPPCFAGHCDWRLPTSAGCCGDPTGQAAELESIVDTGVAGCESGSPCVASVFNSSCTPGCTAASCSCTIVPDYYWSGSALSADPSNAFFVTFNNGGAGFVSKSNTFYARAAR